MKKRTKALIILAVVLLGALAWYVIPVKFIPDNAVGISRVDVFNGTSGGRLTITDPDIVEYIVEEFRGDSFRRGKLALGMGTMFHLTFISEQGDAEAEFILQMPDKVKQGNFFYHPADGGNYRELWIYLEELMHRKASYGNGEPNVI